MKTITHFLPSLIIISIISFACPSEKNTDVSNEIEKDSLHLSEAYVAFPSGYNYPLADSTITRYIKQEDMAAIRTHGWNLWAGLNQPASNGKLIWQTWYSVSDAFAYAQQGTIPALSGLRKSPHHRSKPSNEKVDDWSLINKCNYSPSYDTSSVIKSCGPDNGFLANNGDIMIAGVIYNLEAYKHIRNNKLYLQSTLQGLLDNSKSSIPQFPKGSIVLKHMYWPVQGIGYSALPVWDQNPICSVDGYNGYETWQRAVAIDPTNQMKQKTASVTYLYLDKANAKNFPRITFMNAKVVPINQFYAWQIDANTWKAMTDADQCIINNSFQWAYGRNFMPGDYLVSIAMHITTKEIYDWTMQSLWWHDQPNVSYYAQNKPTNISVGPWQNYLLTTAYSMVTPKEKDGSPNVAYNPYIELVIPEKKRMLSNCQNCHTRGAWPNATDNFLLDPIGFPDKPWSPGSHYNSSQRGQINENDSIFKNLVKTDFSWAIPDRAVNDLKKK